MTVYVVIFAERESGTRSGWHFRNESVYIESERAIARVMAHADPGEGFHVRADKVAEIDSRGVEVAFWAITSWDGDTGEQLPDQDAGDGYVSEFLALHPVQEGFTARATMIQHTDI